MPKSIISHDVKQDTTSKSRTRLNYIQTLQNGKKNRNIQRCNQSPLSVKLHGNYRHNHDSAID